MPCIGNSDHQAISYEIENSEPLRKQKIQIYNKPQIKKIQNKLIKKLNNNNIETKTLLYFTKTQKKKTKIYKSTKNIKKKLTLKYLINTQSPENS